MIFAMDHRSVKFWSIPEAAEYVNFRPWRAEIPCRAGGVSLISFQLFFSDGQRTSKDPDRRITATCVLNDRLRTHHVASGSM